VFSIIASMMDFMIYVGTLSAVKLSWSDTVHSLLVGATTASGTQVAASEPLNCLLAPYPPGYRVLLSMVALAASGPVALMLVVFLANWTCGRKGSGVLGYALREWGQTSFLVAAVLYQPAVANQVFALFRLTPDINGKRYMVDDMSVEQGDWRARELLIAITVLGAYVLGLPLVLLAVLRNKQSRFAPALAFMFKSFKPERKYWSIVVVLRKTALAALVAWPGVQQPWDQVYLAMWVMALSTASHLIWVPYEQDELQKIELCSMTATTAIFAMALYIPVGVDSQDNSSADGQGSSVGANMSFAIGAVTLLVIGQFLTVICKHPDVARALAARCKCCRGAEKISACCRISRTAGLEEPLVSPEQADEGRDAKLSLVSNDRGVRLTFNSS
jgi:hypothetical protein